MLGGTDDIAQGYTKDAGEGSGRARNGRLLWVLAYAFRELREGVAARIEEPTGRENGPSVSVGPLCGRSRRPRVGLAADAPSLRIDCHKAQPGEGQTDEQYEQRR